MQKSDLELQETVLSAIDDSAHNWIMQYDDEAFEEFMDTLTSKGYKIVKDDAE